MARTAVLSRSSSPSTTRRRACPPSSRGSIRRSTRSASRYEVIFVNDGSRDRSAALLREQFQRRPDVTRVVLFNANYGQHLAIIAGFERCRGERVVTLDADLQNPPEEIAKLLAAMDEGYDYVGGVRATREDSWWRRAASRAMNRCASGSRGSR